MRRASVCLTCVLVVAGCSCFGSVEIAAALPLGRHYEMVSPVSKGGFGATLIYAVSPDGERVAFYSPGVFDGAPSTVLLGPDYLAGRGEREWLTHPTPVPSSMSDETKTDFSPDLRVELGEGSSVVHEYEPQDELDTWLRSTSLSDTPEDWQSLVNIYRSTGHEVALLYETASADFCHLILHNLQGLGNPVAEAEGTSLRSIRRIVVADSRERSNSLE